MFLLKKLLAAWLLPPIGLLLLGLLAVIFLKGRSVRFAAGGIMGLALLLSLPIVADPMCRSLEGQPISPAELKHAQAIVILGGGVHYGAPEYGGDTLSESSLERVRFGAKLSRESGLPLLVSGGRVYGGQAEGELMKQVLENEFSASVRWVEAKSLNTQENAANSTALLRSAGIFRVALVTHAWHMPRASSEFRHAGLEVIPAPMGFAPRGISLFERLLPSPGAFERSATAIHEWVGLLLVK